MSLYPSLEDMKVDQMCRAQISHMEAQVTHVASAPQATSQPHYPYPDFNNSPMPVPGNAGQGGLYPALGDFMGLELSEAVIAANMPEYTALSQISAPATSTGLVAPISGQSLGLHRAQVTNGVRQVVLCKDKEGKVGVRVKAINNGIFVCVVVDKSPAALAGIRFGDQILQINDIDVAGYSMDKVHDMFKKSPVNGIKVVLRDRPFERTITLHKDSVGCVGFMFKNGKIHAIVKSSSSSRNGVLTEHQLLEVNGQNVVGMKDKHIHDIINKSENVVTITVIPCFIYEHMIKKMSGSLLKDLMDHSIPSL